MKAEEDHLDFDTDNSKNYNVQFTIRELCDALKKSHDTATGPNEIHLHLWRHLIYLMIYGLEVKFLNAGKRPE